MTWKARKLPNTAPCCAISARSPATISLKSAAVGADLLRSQRNFGCKVTALTISHEQFDFATERMKAAGISHLVDIKFEDYRDERGSYDHVVSIEMFEAVGEKHWPTYFAALRDRLKPGGRAGLQVITINEAAFEPYKKRPDFIQAYVFPGGMLPTPNHLRALGSAASLAVTSELVFAKDYARTLAEWRTRFWDSWGAVSRLGFDERFKRLWEFYLFYCEAGFRSQYIDVRHVVFAKTNNEPAAAGD